jgi:hypothetical protein
MNPLNTREIARRLAERADVEPPEGLLEKIKSEIPAELGVAPRIVERLGREDRTPRRRVWLMAASVAAALGGGVLALHVMQSSPPPERVMQEHAVERKTTVPEPAPQGQAPEAQAAPSLQAQEQDKLESAGASRDEEETAKEKKDAGLRALGYAVSAPEALPAPPPPAPPPPQLAKPMPAPAAPAMPLEVEGGAEGKVEGQVEGQVAGGVIGGVPGGVPGGVVGRNEVQKQTRQGVSLDLRRDAPARAKTAAAAPSPSTGGTAEPNDQAHGDVFSESAGVNPFVDTEDDRLSTFGLDVDTGSYTVARHDLLDEGHLPPPETIRAEEFVSFFSYGDEPPARGDFALHAEGAPTPFAAGPQYRLLRFNVRGREVTAENRQPLQTIAKDAKVQVDFNPAAVSRWRLIGYENRDIADPKLRDDTVGAGEIGAGHSVTALYEVKLKPGAVGKIATLHLRFRAAGTGVIRETARDLRVSELAPSWEAASPGFHLAALVGELAEVLRGSYWAKDVNLDDLVSRARHTATEMVDSKRAVDVLDFVRMVEATARLKKK